jgi:hypothetical protein
MADRNENSVLTSLGALREIEEDRLKMEEVAVQQRAEAEQRARESAQELARQAEQEKLRLAEEAQRADQEAIRREAREAQLRLAEAEQSARIDADAKLETERMRLEAESMISTARRSRWVAPTFVGLAVILTAGLGYVFGVHLPERQRQQKEASQQRIRQMQVRADADRKALLQRLDKQSDRLQAAIANSKDQVEVKRLKDQLTRLQAEQKLALKTGSKATKRTRYGNRGRVRTRTPKKAKPPKKPDPSDRNNPLRGLF